MAEVTAMAIAPQTTTRAASLQARGAAEQSSQIAEEAQRYKRRGNADDDSGAGGGQRDRKQRQRRAPRERERGRPRGLERTGARPLLQS